MGQFLPARINRQFYAITGSMVNQTPKNIIIATQTIQEKPLRFEIIKGYSVGIKMLTLSFVRQDRSLSIAVNQDYRITRIIIIVSLKVLSIDSLSFKFLQYFHAINIVTNYSYICSF